MNRCHVLVIPVREASVAAATSAARFLPRVPTAIPNCVFREPIPGAGQDHQSAKTAACFRMNASTVMGGVPVSSSTSVLVPAKTPF